MNLFFKASLLVICTFCSTVFITNTSLAESASVRFDSPSFFSVANDSCKVNWVSENKATFIKLSNKKVLRDLFGYLSASINIELPKNLQTKNWNIDFSWAPQNSSFSWPSGRLLSVKTNSGILTLETLRRGRFGVKLNGKLLSCTPWLNWGHKKFKKITLVKQNNSILLFIDGKLKLYNTVFHELKPQTINVGTPKSQALLCSGGYWDYLKISPESMIKLTPVLKEKIKLLKTNPYKLKILNDKFKLVEKLEALRAIYADDICSKKTKAKLTVLQVAWDAWLSRMHYRIWDGWEKSNPGSKEWFALALKQIEIMANKLQRRLKKYPPQYKKQANKNEASGPWKIKNGKIYRNNTPDLYQGFIGWTMGSAASDISNMGGNLVSISIWPSLLYDQNNVFLEDRWQEVVARTMAVAKTKNMAVDILITAYSPISLLRANPKWKKTCGHGFLKVCVLDENYNKFARDFLSKALVKLKDYSALVSVCIGNELQFDEHCLEAQKRFHDILKNEFKNINNFNKRFGTKFKKITDIKVARKDVHKANLPKWISYWRKNMWEIGNAHVAELISACKNNAPKIPLHIKVLPNEFSRPALKGNWKWGHWDFPDGIDRPSLVNKLDLAGTDSWAGGIRKKTSDNFISETNVMYQQMYYDYLTGLNSQKPIFDSEWHVLNGHWPMPPKQYRSTIWLGVTSGVQAASLWVWHDRIERLTVLVQPNVLREMSNFFLKLQKRKALVNEIRTNRFAPIALIYDHNLCREYQSEYISAMLSTYRQLVFMGRRPMIIDTRNIEKRSISNKLKTVIYIMPPNRVVKQNIFKNITELYMTWTQNKEGKVKTFPNKNIFDARNILKSEKDDKFNLRLFKRISALCPGIKKYKPVHGVVPLQDSSGQLRMLVNITLKRKSISSHRIMLQSFDVHFVKSKK